MRKDKTVHVYECEIDGYNEIPKKASDFMAFWQTQLNKIPADFIDSAEIEIEATSGYDYATLDVDVTYVRPESDSEMKSREDREQKLDIRDRARKLETYNELKQELGL